jgi:hypothetical protein
LAKLNLIGNLFLLILWIRTLNVVIVGRLVVRWGCGGGVGWGGIDTKRVFSSAELPHPWSIWYTSRENRLSFLNYVRSDPCARRLILPLFASHDVRARDLLGRLHTNEGGLLEERYTDLLHIRPRPLRMYRQSRSQGGRHRGRRSRGHVPRSQARALLQGPIQHRRAGDDHDRGKHRPSSHYPRGY